MREVYILGKDTFYLFCSRRKRILVWYSPLGGFWTPLSGEEYRGFRNLLRRAIKGDSGARKTLYKVLFRMLAYRLLDVRTVHIEGR